MRLSRSFVIRIIKTQLVTHLMLDGGEQVEMARGRAQRIGIAPRGRDRATEEQVTRRIGADVPALAAGVPINLDVAVAGFAEIRAAEIGNVELDPTQDSNLFGCQAVEVQRSIAAATIGSSCFWLSEPPALASGDAKTSAAPRSVGVAALNPNGKS